MNSLGVPEEIRERHGVSPTLESKHLVSVKEGSDYVAIIVNDGTRAGGMSVRITPDEARYIAAKLKRVAWRVEARQ